MNQISGISREAPVLIAGPTASGKSALAREIAARDGRVIVNADALQVYGCWRVLTARPSLADEAALPHALYGHVGRQESYSTGRWLREVVPFLAQPVVIVGGTGLNFSALTEGLADIPAVPPEVRAEARVFLPWVVVAPVIGVAAWIYDGIFIGATLTAEMRRCMMLSVAIYAAALALLVPSLGNHGLWAALMALNAARGVTMARAYPAVARKIAA